LRKSHIFSKHFKIVGIDVCLDVNHPAISKHQLLKHWPQPETVPNIAKLMGFAQFYSKFIPHFELQIAPFCKLTTKFEYTDAVAPHWTTAAQDALTDAKETILSDACLKQFDHHCPIVFRADFSSHGFGCVVCQPGAIEALTVAMDANQSSSDFSFTAKSSTAVLHPVASGARRCCSNEICLHSHLSKDFASNWWINKCRHMLFGQQIVWAANCYTIKFILSYYGSNPAILHLQMRLMCWDVNIVHQNNNYLVNADYWSCLVTDLCFGLLFKKYSLSSPGHFVRYTQHLPAFPCYRRISHTTVFHVLFQLNHLLTLLMTSTAKQSS
jgi:hypothetical protein